MQRFRLARRIRRACAILTLAALAAAGAGRPAMAAPVSVYLFNVNATAVYAVSRNGVPVSSSASSEDGALVLAVDATPGDMIAMARDGDLQPPSPPLFTGLAGTDPGCARATWMASGDPTVVGYVVGYGGQPAAEAGGYEYTADAGSAVQFDVCSLPAGTWYFAVRARNHMGMLSAYSAERVVVVITVAVLISEFDARVMTDGVHLRWRVSADEAVQGYRVYRRADGQGEMALHGGLLPAGENGYVDRGTGHGSSYTYTLAAVGEDGEETRSQPVSVTTPALALALEQNFPNPFNPVTEIPFSIPSAARVAVRIHDVRGARVATLFDGRLEAGRHVLPWTGVDDAGRAVASGPYFYTLVTGGRAISRKMVLLK
jgi:type IV secretory pathway protease TraF